MDLRIPLIASALLVASSASAGSAVSDMHPEAAYPDDAPGLVSPGPYVEVIKQVQERLRQLDFDPGPANGVSSSKLQAALAQFQLSEALPVSGMLDQRTVLALGLDPADLVTASQDTAPQDAAAGGSAD